MAVSKSKQPVSPAQSSLPRLVTRTPGLLGDRSPLRSCPRIPQGLVKSTIHNLHHKQQNLDHESVKSNSKKDRSHHEDQPWRVQLWKIGRLMQKVGFAGVLLSPLRQNESGTRSPFSRPQKIQQTYASAQTWGKKRNLHLTRYNSMLRNKRTESFAGEYA